MRQTNEFWFVLSTTYLKAIVVILLFLGGTREHIWALWGFIFQFIKFFTRLDVCANFGEFFSMFMGSAFGLKRYTCNDNEQTVQLH